MKKIHGLQQGRKIQVVPAMCYKPKPQFAEEYDCQPWHHIAVIKEQYGIIYVWDTREVVATTYLSPLDLHNMTHVLDNGQDLVIPEHLSNDDKAFIQELQQRLDDEPVDCF